MRILSIVIITILFSIPQTKANPNSVNLRLSFLLFPFTPLLSIESRISGSFTLQFESNFTDTHGFNFKWFLNKRMQEDYLFIGTAVVSNTLLRDDGTYTFLPYAGYGFAKRFGESKNWTWDSRAGLGGTLNSENNSLYPIIKTGVGRVF